MPLDHLWATWRSAYVGGIADSRSLPESDGLSLFERILAAEGDDDDKGIVHRGRHCFVILNRFPYTSGHTMVLPNRAVADLEHLDPEEFDELWALVRDVVVASREGLRCEALNVGVNLGEAAGGSQSDHLHVHVVPRWTGDANFVSVAAETRVLPLSLDEAAGRLRAAWPRATG